jgi:hypothetical protein
MRQRRAKALPGWRCAGLGPYPRRSCGPRHARDKSAHGGVPRCVPRPPPAPGSQAFRDQRPGVFARGARPGRPRPASCPARARRAPMRRPQRHPASQVSLDREHTCRIKGRSFVCTEPDPACEAHDGAREKSAGRHPRSVQPGVDPSLLAIAAAWRADAGPRRAARARRQRFAERERYRSSRPATPSSRARASRGRARRSPVTRRRLDAGERSSFLPLPTGTSRPGAASCSQNR